MLCSFLSLQFHCFCIIPCFHSGSCSTCRVWFQLSSAPTNIGGNIAVYGPTVLVGAGGATILVTSLSMVADLIDNATVRIQYFRIECVCLKMAIWHSVKYTLYFVETCWLGDSMLLKLARISDFCGSVPK